MYGAIAASSAFEIVGLKNKISQGQEPFNLLLNVLFHPEEVQHPIVAELELCVASIYDLSHCSNLLYEVTRARTAKGLLDEAPSSLERQSLRRAGSYRFSGLR